MVRALFAVVQGIVLALVGAVVVVPVADASFPGGNGKIVFVSTRAASTTGSEGESDLFTIGPGGKRVTTVTANESFEVNPRWSPGGQRIAFSRYGRAYAIYVMRADGSGARKITSPSRANDLFPTWSPNARQIAFVRAPATSKSYLAGRVLVVNADGTYLRRLPFEPGEYSRLMWSPDGTMLAYSRQQHVYVVGADGSGLRRLFPSTPWINGFAWSPDSLRIAATRDDPAPEIAVVDADGTGEATLVPDVRAADISWSPDGRKIVYQTPTGDRLAVADIATGASRVLETGPGNAYWPDWQPLR